LRCAGNVVAGFDAGKESSWLYCSAAIWLICSMYFFEKPPPDQSSRKLSAIASKIPRTRADRSARGDPMAAAFLRVMMSCGAVAAENSPQPEDVFLFYEYVAEAGESEDDMARALILELATLCHNQGVQEAARLVESSYRAHTKERVAWDLRYQAGSLIPFRVFRGSHEAASERKTLRSKWGLPIIAGKAGKTEGLSQLRFYLKPEQKRHPFRPDKTGRPNLYLVVADDQLRSARDRFGLARHRWEAANLRWDPNVTTRDIPVKFGDDATDAVKQYLQTFAMTAAPLTPRERQELEFPEELREENAPDFGNDDWARDGWALGRERAAEIQKRRNQGGNHWANDICAVDPNDPWNLIE
jgi:hypothetical protein